MGLLALMLLVVSLIFVASAFMYEIHATLTPLDYKRVLSHRKARALMLAAIFFGGMWVLLRWLTGGFA